jgi:hypothetical protein
MSDNKSNISNDNSEYSCNTILSSDLMTNLNSKWSDPSISESELIFKIESELKTKIESESESKIESELKTKSKIESELKTKSKIESESSNYSNFSDMSLITNINSHHSQASSNNKSHSNNSVHSKNTEIDNNFILNNKIIIDIAVLCQEYTNIDITCKDNIINLDEIAITKEIFQSIFYPYCDNFGINKDFINNNEQILPYISIHPDFRTYNKKRFFLLEELIANIERDLNISRNCFTKESIIELTTEISSIKTLCDINCCSVLSSLTWLNILEIINNYKLVKLCLCNFDCHCPKYNAIPVCVLNLIFKTPTSGVKNTIIRLHYRIINL